MRSDTQKRVAAFAVVVLLSSLFYFTFQSVSTTAVVSLLPSSFKENSGFFSYSPSAAEKNTILIGEGQHPPITTVLQHVQGFTVFENVYLRNGTLFIVHPDSASLGTSAQAAGYPLREDILSKPVDRGPDMEDAPRDEELTFLNVSNASDALGPFAQRINGMTLVVYDTVQYMHHYYHWWGEIILGAWRVYTTIDQRNVTHKTFPPTWSETAPMHFIMPFSEHGSWRDGAGVDSPLMHAAFPSAALEESTWWNDLQKLGTAVVFDRLMIVSRNAAHRHPNSRVWYKMIASSMDVKAKKGFWEPLRKAVVQGMLGHVPPVNERGAVVDPGLQSQGKVLPLVTYVSRQGNLMSEGKRKLAPKDHEELVAALEDLEREAVIRFHLARMENTSTREQIELAARTTVMIGVHGNGLTHQLWMPPSPWSTVMEIFRPKAYIFDYEILSRNTGHRHYAVWNDTFVTYPEDTYHQDFGYAVNFHGTDIPVFGPAVAAKIKELLLEKH